MSIGDQLKRTRGPGGESLLGRAADLLGIPLTDAQILTFLRYSDLIGEWNERAGLTAITDPTEVVRRHFVESLALLRVVRDLPEHDERPGGEEAGPAPATRSGPGALEPPPLRIADLGSGAGLPGIPMRIADPRLDLWLIESHGRRARFLEMVVRELSLDGVQVVHARAEDAARRNGLRESYDIVVARALKPLPVLVEMGLPLLRVGGVLATPKGSRALEELELAGPAIRALGGEALDPQQLPLPAEAGTAGASADTGADDGPTVLLVRRVGEIDDRYPRRAGVPERRPLH